MDYIFSILCENKEEIIFDKNRMNIDGKKNA